MFWPVRGAQGTKALLAIEVEREQHNIFYTIGLVMMLSFWFIGVAVVTVATTGFVGAIWLFNTLTIWGVGLVLVVLALVVVLLLIWYRRNGGFGARGRRGGAMPA